MTTSDAARAKYRAEVDGARDYTALFRTVKRLVERELGKSRAGLMLGLTSLGVAPNGFLGGYFVLGSNAIVLNKDVLNHVQANEPDHHNAYAFHVLLHEYLHTIGYVSEDDVRPLAHALSERALGPDHSATLIAAAMLPGATDGDGPALFRRIAYPPVGWRPATPAPLHIVKGFDPEATSYIM